MIYVGGHNIISVSQNRPCYCKLLLILSGVGPVYRPVSTTPQAYTGHLAPLAAQSAHAVAAARPPVQSAANVYQVCRQPSTSYCALWMDLEMQWLAETLKRDSLTVFHVAQQELAHITQQKCPSLSIHGAACILNEGRRIYDTHDTLQVGQVAWPSAAQQQQHITNSAARAIHPQSATPVYTSEDDRQILPSRVSVSFNS